MWSTYAKSTIKFRLKFLDPFTLLEVLVLMLKNFDHISKTNNKIQKCQVIHAVNYLIVIHPQIYSIVH